MDKSWAETQEINCRKHIAKIGDCPYCDGKLNVRISVGGLRVVFCTGCGWDWDEVQWDWQREFIKSTESMCIEVLYSYSRSVGWQSVQQWKREIADRLFNKRLQALKDSIVEKNIRISELEKQLVENDTHS